MTYKQFLRLLAIFLAGHVFLCPVYSQNVDNSWTLSFDQKPKWTSVDLQTNTIFYYDGEKIGSYNYVDKQSDWNVPLKNYIGADYSYNLESPNLLITEPKKFTVHNKQKKAVVIERGSGKILFDTYQCNVFDESQIHFTKDHKYALLVRIEKIKKDKKKGIKKQINHHLSLVKLGDSKALWTVQLPKDDIRRGFLSNDKDFTFGPVANDKVVVFSHGRDLMAYNIADGSMRWKQNLAENKIRHLSIADRSHQKEGFLLTYNGSDTENYSINFISFDDGKPLWDAPADLGRYYSISYGEKRMLTKTSEGFNFLRYDGTTKWVEPIKASANIEHVYQQDDGYLLITKKRENQFMPYTYGINWVNTEQKMAFPKFMPINSETLRDGIHFDGYLVLVDNAFISTYDTKKGILITKIPLAYHQDFSINEKNKTVTYTDYHTVYRLDPYETKSVKLVDRPKFKSKKDTIWRVEAFDDSYVMISNHESF